MSIEVIKDPRLHEAYNQALITIDLQRREIDSLNKALAMKLDQSPSGLSVAQVRKIMLPSVELLEQLQSVEMSEHKHERITEELARLRKLLPV